MIALCNNSTGHSRADSGLLTKTKQINSVSKGGSSFELNLFLRSDSLYKTDLTISFVTSFNELIMVGNNTNGTKTYVFIPWHTKAKCYLYATFLF